MNNPEIVLTSNIKRITSNQAPSELELPLGFIAFGEVMGEYRIFGNSDGNIVDLTNFVVISQPDTVKGRIGGEGPTQDLPFEELKYLLGIPIFELTGDSLNIRTIKKDTSSEEEAPIEPCCENYPDCNCNVDIPEGPPPIGP